jgi:hypothetical protein
MATSSSPLSVTASLTLQVVKAAGGGGNTGGGGSQVGSILTDGFESADLSSPEYLGFTWGVVNSTSIVTMSAAGNPTVVYNGNSINNELVGDSRDWTARTGSFSLRFRYAGGVGDSWAEQRYSFTPAQREIWKSFWVRVPVNYTHRQASPENNKLFFMWMDGYSTAGDGSSVGMEMRPTAEGGSTWYCKIGAGRFANVGGDLGGYQPFISVPSDRGRWMNIVTRVVTESTQDAGDGSMEVWRKWDGDAEYTKPFNLTGYVIRVPPAGPAGFAAGYLMGYSNSGYAADTEWLIDDVAFATESLL